MWFIVLALLFVLLLSVLLLSNRNYWKLQNVVQTKEILLAFVLGNKSLSEIYKDMYEEYRDEKYVGFFFGRRPGVLLRDLKDVQSVLASDFESFYHRGILINDDDVLGNNILSLSDYNKWKLIRHKISPIFTTAKLKNMCYIMVKCASDFVEMVKKNQEMRSKPFNAIYTYTTASIGASVFGIDTRVKNSMESPFLEMAWQTVTPSFKTNSKFLLSTLSPGLFKLFNLKPFGNHEKFFVGAVKKVLERRRGETKAVHDFIDLCLELQKNGTMKDLATGYELEPTDEVMAAQAFFFFIAGADTSANTMHFTLLELANNPDVLQKLLEEIDKLFTDHDQELSYDDIENMQYLDMVLNEAMRKYPPVGVVHRQCTKNTVLPSGNLKIAKDDMVAVPIYAIHRDPQYYPDPDKFDPERFAQNKLDQLPKYGYFPFGDGKRICLGARFAKLQVKAGLAYLLRSFTLKEQKYEPKRFEKSVFALRDSDAYFELIPRN